MRLLVDAQAVQSSSSLRGIGRYSLCLLEALVGTRGEHQVEVLLNGGDDQERLLRARAAIETFLTARQVHVYDAPWPWREPARPELRPAADAAYAAAVEAIGPDVLLVLSVLESDRENVVSVRGLRGVLPVAAVLYDLIPAADPGTYLLGPGAGDYWRRVDELREADVLLCISDYSAAQAVRLLSPACPPTATVWGGPFRTGAFPAYEQTDDERPQLRPPERYLLAVGGDHPRKNLDRLVTAWGSVPKQERGGAALVVACGLNPGTQRRLRRIGSQAGLEDGDVLLTGRVSDQRLTALYQGADGFVFPSTEEGLGLPPLEAMAAGCPTVLARGSSLVELTDEPAAFFDGEDTVDMAGALRRLLGDVEHRERLRQAAAVSTARLTWGAAAQRCWDALGDLLPHEAPVGIGAPADEAHEPGPDVRVLTAKALDGHSGTELRLRAAPASAVVVDGQSQASQLVRAGLVDLPLLHPDEQRRGAAHDPVARLVRRLGERSVAGDPYVVRQMAEALVRPARWSLQRPRPVWLLLTSTWAALGPELQEAADARGADLLVVPPTAAALAVMVDAVAVEDGRLDLSTLADAHCRGAGVVVVDGPSASAVDGPPWARRVAVSAGWPAVLDALEDIGPRCGWPWRG